MRFFRLCSARFGASIADAFSGAGGLAAGARWHTRGRPIVYAAQSLSLAALEVLVHLKRNTGHHAFVYFSLEVPAKAMDEIAGLPENWKTDRRVTQAIGDRWLEDHTSPALRVPGALVPGEFNLLLNPVHHRFSLNWATSGPVHYAFDSRLLVSGET